MHGNYDGTEKTFTLEVTEPTEGVEIYYSEEGALTEENYSEATTTKPTRTNAGTSNVWWYIHTTNSNYADTIGSNTITIHKVDATVTVEITGEAQIGGTLTANTTTESNGVKSYQWWYSEEANATTGTEIENANESTLVIPDTCLDKYIGCTVTVTEGTNHNRCNGNAITSSMAVLLEKISKTTSYIGYNADVDGDGASDGVIYADLAIGGSGGSGAGAYTIPKVDNVKDYYIERKYDNSD